MATSFWFCCGKPEPFCWEESQQLLSCWAGQLHQERHPISHMPYTLDQERGHRPAAQCLGGLAWAED